MDEKPKSNRNNLNPTKFEKALKVISIYVENDVFKFTDIAMDIYASKGNKIEGVFKELKAAYAYYYVLAEDNIAENMESDIRDITYEFLLNKIKMEQKNLSFFEELGKKKLMEFLENIILNFKSKNISSFSLMGLSKAYYLLDNYKKITYEGYFRLEANERDENADLHSYVLRIYCDEVTLSYEGYIHGSYGGDSEYEEMYNFNTDYDDFDEPQLNFNNWINNFNEIFQNKKTFDYDDLIEDIEEVDIDEEGECEINNDLEVNIDKEIMNKYIVIVTNRINKFPKNENDDFKDDAAEYLDDCNYIIDTILERFPNNCAQIGIVSFLITSTLDEQAMFDCICSLFFENSEKNIEAFRVSKYQTFVSKINSGVYEMNRESQFIIDNIMKNKI